jgi:hypothetical protein
MQQSAPIFKQILRLINEPNDQKLVNFLKKIKQFLGDIKTGNSLLLPIIVENHEMMLIVERASDRLFRFVIVQTDPLKGLRHHSVSPTVSVPNLKYRTCMVLTDIPKKNALDDVFWMALYNMSIHPHDGDTDKFYDILIPFLTGKSLESSLVAAEQSAIASDEKLLDAKRLFEESVQLSLRGQEKEALVLHNAAIDLEQESFKLLACCGQWRSPQRSLTAYVRCFVEAMNYMCLCRGMSENQTSQVQLALFAEMVCMMKNDLNCVFPDENGVRVCKLAIQELCYAAVSLSDLQKIPKDVREESKIDTEFILSEIYTLVTSTNDILSNCVDDEIELPPVLDLSEKTSEDPNDPALTQFRDLLMWSVAKAEPDPGQSISLTKYIPVDFLQIPQRARNRAEAIESIRLCDRLCTLLENQSHCIKNEKFLILSCIEHVFVQVVPVPKPRDVKLSEEELYVSQRADRIAKKKSAEEAKKSSEKYMDDEVVPGTHRSVVAQYSVTSTTGMFIRASELRSSESVGSVSQGDIVECTEECQICKTKGGTVAIRVKLSDGRGWITKSDGGTSYLGAVEGPSSPEDIEALDLGVGLASQTACLESACIWDEPITYALQVELLLTLQRLMEHFSAATMSISQSRSFDGVFIVVPGCLVAISDAIIRQIATDRPSEVCTQLSGKTVLGKQLGVPGFGISISTFATQCETIELHNAELSVARTAILDYFQSPAQKRLEKMFEWEFEYHVRPDKNTVRYLRMVAREIGYGNPRPHFGLIDSNPMSSLLMKNYPELRSYRDIVFWWKHFLNPDRKSFLNYSDPKNPRELNVIPRMDSQLSWGWEENEQRYQVSSYQGKELFCRPNPKQVDPLTGKVLPKEFLPTHRFPSTATPSFYLPAPAIKTEDDVIYRPNLPTFENKHGQVLNQRDSELLLSYLTVPYIRLPLILTFFSTEDRIHKLQSPELRAIFDSVLFEPGKYLRMDMTNVEPLVVPTQHPALLATPFGLLMNEMSRSPDTIIRSVLVLLRGALACDTGSVADEDADEFNVSTQIILYLSRVGARVDNYLSFLIDHARGEHDTIVHELRGSDIPDDILSKLIQGRESLRELLHEKFSELFEDYLHRLQRETENDPTNEKLIDRNSRLACDLHAHKFILYRNYHERDMLPDVLKTLIGSFVYLTTRHTWNKATTEDKRLCVPETEIYEMMYVVRRRTINWMLNCKQGICDEIMQTALQISSSLTGSFKTSAEVLDNQNRWSRIMGVRSIGRWAVGSTRTIVNSESSESLAIMPPLLSRSTSYYGDVGEVGDTSMLVNTSFFFCKFFA